MGGTRGTRSDWSGKIQELVTPTANLGSVDSDWLSKAIIQDVESAQAVLDLARTPRLTAFNVNSRDSFGILVTNGSMAQPKPVGILRLSDTT